MIKFKSLITEIHDVETLRPKDIFNFYYLWHTAVDNPQAMESPYGREVLNYYLGQFKKKYVGIFTKLVFRQIQKYIQRGRLDQDFPTEKFGDGSVALDPGELLLAMKKTFRSDMKRRNDRWITIADALSNLSRSTAPKDIFLWVNQLNNAVHNTDTSVIGKFDNSGELFRTFDTIHKTTNMETLKSTVDKDIRDLNSQSQLGENFQDILKKAGVNPNAYMQHQSPRLPGYRDNDEPINRKKPIKPSHHHDTRPTTLKVGALEEAGKDHDFYDAMYGANKRIPPNRPPDKTKPMIKVDEPEPEKKPETSNTADIALQEDNTVRISKSDRNNQHFMAGLKTGVLDKGSDYKRDLNGEDPDFIRGYKMVKREGWWSRINNKLTGLASDLGHSYGRRF